MQFSREEYLAQQSNRGNKQGQGSQFPKTHFVNEYLKRDGDTVVVRYPYKSANDFVYSTTHSVFFPGNPIAKRVRCEGAGKCPLCAQGVKVDSRMFVKALVYVTNAEGNIEVLPAIWDKPSAFADIELNALIKDYGDISTMLFKIRRNGTGTSTRYTMTPIINKDMYPDSIYKADFSLLESVDPEKVLTKSIEQYEQAKNPQAAPAQPQTYEQPVQTQAPVEAQPQESYQPVGNIIEEAERAIQQQTSQPAPAQPEQPVRQTGSFYNQNTEQRRPTRYTF